jgi:hypothetical protein
MKNRFLILLATIAAFLMPGELPAANSYTATNDIAIPLVIGLYQTNGGSSYKFAAVTTLATNTQAVITTNSGTWSGVAILNGGLNVGRFSAWTSLANSNGGNFSYLLTNGVQAYYTSSSSVGSTTSAPPAGIPLPISVWAGTNANPNGIYTAGYGSLYNQFDTTLTNLVQQWTKTSATGNLNWIMIVSGTTASNALTAVYATSSGTAAIATTATNAPNGTPLNGLALAVTNTATLGTNPAINPATLLTMAKDRSEALAATRLYLATNSWQALAQSRPFTIVTLGDSLAANQYDAYQAYFQAHGMWAGGNAGWGGGCTTYAGGAYATNGPVYGPLATQFQTPYLPAGGSVVLDGDCSGSSSARLWASYVEVYYFAEPGAGTLTVSASLEGGSYTTLGSVSCSASSLTIKEIGFSMPAGVYNIKLAASSNPVKVYQCGICDRTSKGVQVFNEGVGGADWVNYTSFTNWTALAAAIQPNLVIIQQISSSNDWAVYSPYTLTNFMAGCPNADVILVSPNPIMSGTDPTGTANTGEDASIKSVAASNGWTFFDQYQLYMDQGGTNWMNNNFDIGAGFAASGAGIHPQHQLRVWAVNQLMQAIGFDSLISQNTADDVSLNSYTSNGNDARFYSFSKIGAPNLQYQYGNSTAYGNVFGLVFSSPQNANEGFIRLDSTGYHLGNYGGGANWNYNPRTDSIQHVTGGFDSSAGGATLATTMTATNGVVLPATNKPSYNGTTGAQLSSDGTNITAVMLAPSGTPQTNILAFGGEYYIGYSATNSANLPIINNNTLTTALTVPNVAPGYYSVDYMICALSTNSAGTKGQIMLSSGNITDLSGYIMDVQFSAGAGNLDANANGMSIIANATSGSGGCIGIGAAPAGNLASKWWGQGTIVITNTANILIQVCPYNNGDGYVDLGKGSYFHLRRNNAPGIQ